MITQMRICRPVVLTILAMGVACNVRSGANGRDGDVAGNLAVGGSGGAALAGGSGGSSSSGGDASAGSPGSGGQVGSGGSSATGGVVATGGIKGTGGGAATGGVTGLGGGSATGGAASFAGASASGGSVGTGGVTGFGGTGATGVGKGGSGGNSGGGVPGSGGGTGGINGSGGAAGTGGTGGTGGSVGPSVQALATAFCAAARNCCISTSYRTVDLGDCEAQFPARLEPLALVDKGTVLIDKTALATCIAAYNQTATACTVNSLAPACRGVFVGTKAEGEPCGYYAGEPDEPITWGVHECKASGGAELCVWSQDLTAPTGTCHKAPHGKIGDRCFGSCASGEEWLSDAIDEPSVPAVCFEDDGLYCTWDSNRVCAPIVANGGACTVDPACASANFCDSKTQTCMTAATFGQSCAANGLHCSPDLACDANNQCTEPVFGLGNNPQDCDGWPTVPN